MSGPKQFLQRVAAIVKQAGYRGELSPSSMLDRWSQLVTECEDGYSWDISEFNNELEVRTLIQKLLDDSELRDAPERSEFLQNVDEIDARFRPLLQSDVTRPYGNGEWWNAGILRRSREEYAAFMKAAYDVDVDVVE